MCVLKIVEFGPVRTIGISCVGSQSAEFSKLWEQDLIPREREIAMPEGGAAYGVCRCIPGATDGSFEYMALVEATEGSPVPEGMVEHRIPGCRYAVFEVAGLSEIGASWQKASAEVEANPEWEAYCSAKGCSCAEAASFEYYPPQFGVDGKLSLYIPVRPTA